MSVNIYNATNNELKPIASDSIDASTLADKTDISSIVTSGTTNSTGSTITSGTWFYLNGELCRAKVDIANGATFTLNTNYEKKTVSEGLAELNSKTPYFVPCTISTDAGNTFKTNIHVTATVDSKINSNTIYGLTLYVSNWNNRAMADFSNIGGSPTPAFYVFNNTIKKILISNTVRSGSTLEFDATSDDNIVIGGLQVLSSL